MAARSRFYDINTDLDDSYRMLIHTQSNMTDKHQAARDTILRELPKSHSRASRLHTASLNVFIDMVALLDSLVATHTDYATLRRSLRSEEHTSELQSLMRISYAVFCLKKKKNKTT